MGGVARGADLGHVGEALDVEKAEGEATGNDEVVVPAFLGFADKIIDDETDK